MEWYTKFFETDNDITSDTIICADTEVSSYWITEGGKIISYNPRYSDEFYNKCQKGCCLYLWQCCIDDIIYYGREIWQFGDFVKEIEKRFKFTNDKERVTIFFHNLSYDFEVLLRNLYNFDFDKVFARTVGKPIYAELHDTIIFRCSYMMTNLSLASWGKELGLPKLSGEEFNYNKLRSPKTRLTKKELDYASRDIEVMRLGIRKLLEEYVTIQKIPLTNTGQVRREYKKVLKKNISYKKNITRCMPKTVEEYQVKKLVFGGGDTHGNIVNIGKVLEDVGSFDECSAYIGVMFRYKFPCSPFVIVSNDRKLDFNKYDYIFLCHFENIRLKKGCTLSYISKGRSVAVEQGIYDNGRVMKAKSVTAYYTSYDFGMIKRLYDYDNKGSEIVTTRRARKNYLNTDFITKLLEFFEYKTTLKGVAGYEDLYMRSKNRLNASFGVMVMDCVQPVIKFNGDWKAESQLEQDIQACLDDIQAKWWNNYFSYDVGLYITSIARYVLWEAITEVADYKHEFRYNDDVAYFDTDSNKLKNYEKHKEVFEKLNKAIIKASEEACKYHGFSLDKFRPKKPNGQESILGVWEFEGAYKEFKTLGAKKYCYREEDGLHITVSGVPKRASICLNDDINNFKIGFNFDREVCKKSQSEHLNGNNPIVTLKDGYTVNQPFGINIRNCGYTLGLEKDFMQIIDYMREHGEI